MVLISDYLCKFTVFTSVKYELYQTISSMLMPSLFWSTIIRAFSDYVAGCLIHHGDLSNFFPRLINHDLVLPGFMISNLYFQFRLFPTDQEGTTRSHPYFLHPAAAGCSCNSLPSSCDFVAPILVEVFSFSLHHIQTSSTNFAWREVIPYGWLVICFKVNQRLKSSLRLGMLRWMLTLWNCSCSSCGCGAFQGSRDGGGNRQQ